MDWVERQRRPISRVIAGSDQFPCFHIKLSLIIVIIIVIIVINSTIIIIIMDRHDQEKYNTLAVILIRPQEMDL